MNMGVVMRVERLAGRVVAYHLASGQVVDVDLATARLMPPGEARDGMLLVSGTESSGRTWLVALYPNTAVDAPAGCFRLEATGVGVDEWIDLSIGVRLRKAQNFDPGSATNEQYNAERQAFCVNSNGEVMSYGI